MKYLVGILFSVVVVFGGSCIEKFDFTEESDFYVVSVFDYVVPFEDEDLSLEAKMYLLINLKKRYKKKIYGLKMRGFQEIDSYKCDNVLHSVYKIYKKDIIIFYDKNDDSDLVVYRDLKRELIGKIALIEMRDELTLQDYEKLYVLYFSLGKINDTSRIMDKIIELKWSN